MWLWRLIRRREIRAMAAADGQGPHDGADARLTEGFESLSALIAEAKEEIEVPPFDVMYAGMLRKERRLCEQESRQGLWARLRDLLERRPVLVLAPTGAVLAAIVLTFMLHFGRPVSDNRCVVESYTVRSGTVLIDQDPSDPTTPAVIWHVPGG